MKRREILKEIINSMTPNIEYYLGDIYVGDKDKSNNQRIELFNDDLNIDDFNLKESTVKKINSDDNVDFSDLLDLLNNKLSELIKNNDDYLLLDNVKVFFYKEPGRYQYYVRNINDFNKVKSSLIKIITDKSKPLD